MFKCISRRVSAVLMASAIVLAQVVSPVSQAFADAKDVNRGAFQLGWCQQIASENKPTWKFSIGDVSSGDRSRTFALIMTAELRAAIIAAGSTNFDLTVANGTQVLAHDKSDDTATQFCAAQGPVTPVAPAITDLCSTANDTVAAPDNSTSVTYVLSADNKTVVATPTSGHILTASNGYTLNSDGTATYTAQFTNVACSVDPPMEQTVAPEAPVLVDKCGKDNDTLTPPEDSDFVTYSISEDETTVIATPASDVTLTASNGYTLNSDGTASFALTFTDTPCPVTPPTVQACSAMATPITVTKDTQFADYQDTRAHGYYGFSKEGLKIWTTDNTSQSKVAWYHFVNYSLAAIGTPSMNYTPSNDPQYANPNVTLPGMQIVIKVGTKTGILVGEPTAYDTNWWSNTDFGIGGGMGYTSYGTLDAYLAANPTAQVVAVGFSLGSGVYDAGTLHSITFGCQTWSFTMQENPGTGVITPTTPPVVTPVVTPTSNGELPKTTTLPLPAELPHTGGSVNGLLIALIAAISTYGAVHFAQGRRQTQ